MSLLLTCSLFYIRELPRLYSNNKHIQFETQDSDQGSCSIKVSMKSKDHVLSLKDAVTENAIIDRFLKLQ
jgi:hypothetical protein